MTLETVCTWRAGGLGKTEEKEKTTGTTLLLSDGIQGVSATMFKGLKFVGGRRRIAAKIESSIRCMPVALPSLFCIVEEQFLAKKFNVALLCFAHHKV